MKLTPTLLIAAALLLVITVTLELLLIDRSYVHVPFPYADVPGAWLAFGAVWSAVLFFVPKWIGHAFLMRHEDPYTEEVVPETFDREAPHG